MWKILKKIKKGKYDYALVPNHPNATKHGYVLYHRIIMENLLNRLLTPLEVVHHIDRNTHNNNIENLQLVTEEEHRKIHSIRLRTYAEIKCPQCEQVYVKLKKLTVDKKQYCCCKKCGRKFQDLSIEDKQKKITNCVIRIFKE